jgi:hypothetical protein
MSSSIIYKYAEFLTAAPSADNFDVLHSPGIKTPYSGVYRCIACGEAITSVQDHPLPPQNHHQHPDGKPILWQLVVWG